MAATSISLRSVVALALAELDRGERATALALYEKIVAVPDVGYGYRHLIRLLAAELGIEPSYVPERDQSHPFYQPSPSCQIRGLGALYERCFGFKRDGVFVEVGAFDGEHISNTACLADLGWWGLMIEPEPVFFQLCTARHRRNSRVKVVNCAVGPAEGLATLYLGEALSTTVPEQVELYRGMAWARDFHAGGRSVEIPQTKLDSLLESWGAAPGFDLLMIDVEGSELGVMDGFDLARWRPRVAIVELTDVSPEFVVDRRVVEDCAEIRRRFRANGYTDSQLDTFNTLFAAT